MKIPELLAPAGSFKSIRAAVCGGADAVYFGGTAFNARRNAKNMSRDEMGQAVAWCKKYGVKVYITLNILIKDSEIPALMDYLNFLCTLDVDGLIVQDAGLIYLLHKYFPHFALQTSTQGSVYGLFGVRFFERLGFERVVLPREMGIDEVSEIAGETEAELKIFCHGALCYAFSGQCLMSSMIGGRSGNRGLCAQPCRKRYRLIDSAGNVLKAGHLLSPRDLNTHDRIPEIIESGVDALKIEGRMKTPEYVYAVTRAYREALDGVPEAVREMDDYTLNQVFNRDFTEGRLFGAQEIINQAVGKKRGVCIGRVTACKKKAACIRLDAGAALGIGDGLSFGEAGNQGARVQRMADEKGRDIKRADGGTVIVFMENPPEKGQLVYKNDDKALMASLAEAARREPPLPEKRPLYFDITIKTGVPVSVDITDGETRVCFKSDIVPATAEKRSLEAGMVAEQFERLGDTPYALGAISVHLEDRLFLSKGQLNALRRAAIAALERKNISPGPVTLAGEDMKKIKTAEKRPGISVQLQDLSQAKALLNTAAERLILPVSLTPEYQDLKALIDKAHGVGKTIWLRFPRIMPTALSRQLLEGLADISALGADGVLVTNFEILEIFRNMDMPLEADQAMNLFNRFGAKAFADWGFTGAVLSPELRSSEVRTLSESMIIKSVLPVYGRQELMVSANCPLNCVRKHCDHCQDRAWYGLEDSRGAIFPLRRDRFGYTHIYNGDILCLRGELTGQKYLDEWRIYAVGESMDRLEEIIAFYDALRVEGRAVFPEKAGEHYTKGNYKRGVE